MNKNLTELVFILDKSGSMAGLEEDTIGGFNTMLEKQKKEDGEALITTVLFDNNYEVLHSRQDIKTVSPITRDEYFVEGSTALLDAVGKTILRIDKANSQTEEKERPGKVVFVIITDGMENASSKFGYKRIQGMIEHRKSEFSWEFLFLGANMDAVATAAKFGIARNRAVRYKADSAGTNLNFQNVSDAIGEYRASYSRSFPDRWKDDIEKDFNERGDRK